MQIELGGKAYQDLQEALRGGEPGQKLDVSLDGQEVHIQIHTVRQVIEFALKDEAVAACKNRHPSPICTRFEHHFHVLMNIPPQTGQQNGGNRSRVTVEMSPGVRMQVQAVE